MPLELRNPHAVLAALEARPSAVEGVTVGARPSGGWRDVVDAARAAGRPVVDATSSRRGARRGANAFALVEERDETPLGDLWRDPQPSTLWLALDSLQDPQNLGSIFRTAAFFGVRGIALTRDRSAGITDTVYDVASGAVELVPHATVPQPLAGPRRCEGGRTLDRRILRTCGALGHGAGSGPPLAAGAWQRGARPAPPHARPLRRGGRDRTSRRTQFAQRLGCGRRADGGADRRRVARYASAPAASRSARAAAYCG